MGLLAAAQAAGSLWENIGIDEIHGFVKPEQDPFPPQCPRDGSDPVLCWDMRTNSPKVGSAHPSDTFKPFLLCLCLGGLHREGPWAALGWEGI